MEVFTDKIDTDDDLSMYLRSFGDGYREGSGDSVPNIGGGEIGDMVTEFISKMFIVFTMG